MKQPFTGFGLGYWPIINSMQNTLMQAGLSKAQAGVYLLLLDKGTLAPAVVASTIGLTRTNAYKVLGQLMELGLVNRVRKHRRFLYAASDPNALNDLLARERNRLVALEQAVNTSLQTLQAKYRQHTTRLEAKVYHGKSKLVHLYERQAEQRQPVYFVRSRYDTPTLGYASMDYVRQLPAKLGAHQFGIMPDAPEASSNPGVDHPDHSVELRHTWVHEEEYTAPVEWSVSGDAVTIFVFEDSTSVLLITNPAIAESFRQLWRMLDKALRKTPEYSQLPVKAQRAERVYTPTPPERTVVPLTTQQFPEYPRVPQPRVQQNLRTPYCSVAMCHSRSDSRTPAPSSRRYACYRPQRDDQQ